LPNAGKNSYTARPPKTCHLSPGTQCLSPRCHFPLRLCARLRYPDTEKIAMLSSENRVTRVLNGALNQLSAKNIQGQINQDFLDFLSTATAQIAAFSEKQSSLKRTSIRLPPSGLIRRHQRGFADPPLVRYDSS